MALIPRGTAFALANEILLTRDDFHQQPTRIPHNGAHRPNGPMLVGGDVTITLPDGEELERRGRETDADR